MVSKSENTVSKFVQRSVHQKHLMHFPNENAVFIIGCGLEA